jgi:transposase InsO family protein
LLANGVKQEVPLVEVDLSGPNGTEKCVVGVMQSLPVDVLAGHDVFHLLCKPIPSVDSECEIKPIAFVTTRSKAAEEQLRELDVVAKQAIEAPVLRDIHDSGSSQLPVGCNTGPVCVRENDSPSQQSACDVDMVNDRDDSSFIDDGVDSGVDIVRPTSADEVGTDGVNVETIPDFSSLSLDSRQFSAIQRADCTLDKVREKAIKNTVHAKGGYLMKDNLLYRRIVDDATGRTVDQLIVPQSLREKILDMAHSIPIAGHLGMDKTRQRLLMHFYWPGLFGAVRDYCSTCPECQKTSRLSVSDRAKLVRVPIIEKPFSKIAIDIFGPLARTKSGKRYVLTVCDYATRYPEAYALRDATAETVSDSLIDLISKVGIPDEIVSDQGTNFMSELVRQLLRKLHIKKISCSPYHQQSNGLVERFHGCLKPMLQKFAGDDPKEWDKMLPYLLFAYSEVPEASLGFSPFELLYGRQLRGPLSLLKESWSDETSDDQNVVEYVLQMRQRLQEMTELVRENLETTQEKMKTWYDANARGKSFDVGEEVLLLLPTTTNKLTVKWQGPFKITRKVTDVDYEINVGSSRKKLRVYHVNLLKRWKSRENVAFFSSETSDEIPQVTPTKVSHGKSWSDVRISSSLEPEQQRQIKALLEEFSDIFSDKPSLTHLIEHDIKTFDDRPVRQPAYRLPHSLKKKVKCHIAELLEMGIVEHCVSSYAVPLVVVPKKDDDIRLCVNYKKLNEVSEFDPFPVPRVDELIEKVGNAKYLTALDATKGYWQIPLSENSRLKSCFRCEFGTFCFYVMPFGLHSSGATYMRLMQKILGDLDCAEAYIDDVIIFSDTFEEHLRDLREVFTRIRHAAITLKPCKCVVGNAVIDYLGFLVGSGSLKPVEAKVLVIKNFPQPETKKQVRSFIGLVSYYNRFIPNYSETAAPLTDLTKKGHPNRVRWSDNCENAFLKLKEAMSISPVLRAPDYDSDFFLQVDASDRGLGAILYQLDDAGFEHPVIYASRKLLDRERKYAAVEECLGLVWAVDHFRHYLYGRHFTVEVDANPLVWLNSCQDKNMKLLRWSLKLQEYSMTIVHKPGREHVNVDSLSRI